MEAVAVLMPLRRPGVLAAAPPWACRLLAALLILGVAALRLFYLCHDCPLDLAQDEAHYWDWSRHLDWSYYSKGPLVAWLIRASCELFGPLSVHWSGTLMPAVRLPAAACGALLLVSLYVLTVQVYGRDGLALAVVAVGLTLPLLAAGSTLMTIDAPFTCCWGWALVLGHRALFRGSWWAWPAAGLLVGLGVLAKYTMVLWPPSLLLFLLLTPSHRRLLWRPGFWVLCGVAGLSCLPILVWNGAHDWVTFRHVTGLSGAQQAHWDWLGPLAYLGGQALLLLVYWFVAWAAAMLVHHPLREADPGVRYLWWLSAPTFLLFLGFSLKNGGGEVNWPVTAYLSGIVLAVAWVGRGLSSDRALYRWWLGFNLTLTCLVGLALVLALHASETVHPLLARLAGPPDPLREPMPLRRLDPTCRLRGWRTLAARVDAVRADLRAEEGVDPVLAGSNWSIPGELGFYCAGHPQAVSVGLGLGDRHSQYDFWPGPCTDSDVFRGRTFVVVGLIGRQRPLVEAAFDRVEPTEVLFHEVNGQPVAAFSITVCRGFRGFPPAPEADHF